MSRSGYIEDYDYQESALILYRGAVNSAIKGRRGQAFIREAISALDAMPEKCLITGSFSGEFVGEFCTLGVVGHARGMDLQPLDESEPEEVGQAFGISTVLAAEIMFENDDQGSYRANESVTPEKRWRRMRRWLESKLIAPKEKNT